MNFLNDFTAKKIIKFSNNEGMIHLKNSLYSIEIVRTGNPKKSRGVMNFKFGKKRE